MRQVAVTEGDKVEAEIKFGWDVEYRPIGDIVDILNEVTEAEIDAKMAEYESVIQWIRIILTLFVIRQKKKSL